MYTQPRNETKTSLYIFTFLFLMGLLGWIMNLVNVLGYSRIGDAAAVEVLGVFLMPLGAVVGWL